MTSTLMTATTTNIMTSRFLLNNDYLDSDCTIAVDLDSNVDDTVGTWSTNFLILVYCVCLGGIIGMKRVRKRPSTIGRTNETERIRKASIYLMTYFILAGVSFGVAGIGHIIIKSKLDSSITYIMLGVYVPSAIGNIALSLLGIDMVTTGTIIKWIDLIVLIGVYIYAIISESFVINGAISGLVVLGNAIVYAFLGWKNNSCGAFMKSISLFIMIGSFVIQVVGSPRCGSDEAYENCFEDCPFPNEFNHNAVFHVVFLLGIILFSTYERIYPSMVKEEETMEEEDGANWKEETL